MGFCSGNSGDPIFTETFGAGITSSPLPAGTTTYTFAGGSPSDGFYTVSSNTNFFDWHDIDDHTPNDTDGRMLVVNADFTAGEFYRTTISGLCENTSYEFSSWMINLLPSTTSCPNGGIPINVRFEIWDNTDTNLLASGNTGSINGTSGPNWVQYALVFQTLPAQTSVILKMLNNGVGGCGNDLAIDDIVFKTCGDTVTIEDALNNSNIYVCEDQLPFSTQLTAIPDFSIFSSHFYQWQESTDGINWTDIVGENNQNYTPTLTSNTSFYRVLVAEDAVNLTNSSCNSTSEIFEIRVIPFPNAPTSNGDLMICQNDNTMLSVNVPNDVIVNWYDAAVGGNLLQANIRTYSPNGVSGTYYAEAETMLGGCLSTTRTPLQVNYFEIPNVTDETLEFCENTSITLFANPTNPSIVTSYLWSNGETTDQIDVSSAGTYTVQVNSGSCSVIKTIQLNQINNPTIESVISDGNDIIINASSNTGTLLYSLNGNIFQPSNTFFNVDGGLYTIYVKNQECAHITSQSYLHFYIPKFFTPNNDGENDAFDLKGIEYYSTSFVSIFDRYGKLLKSSRNSSFSWDGTFNNQQLPTNDYWYIVVIDGQKFTGHVTLKR
ncbi:T9SS type B sorting domain-containing protein [Jejuia spongiicola]|uniref:T9SS type B sorting domain-containing protein n=1 Tax=Jejuia spongiicola TaxID=2942207 RepID=A0ABT0Q9F5_9FLAO|nr:T9SS type B sorting domain-containing protein [Jejuia spongiicola]MCL6293585.1 T9SS type B sorting domain-containing protein [Jejuia spongiicola]